MARDQMSPLMYINQAYFQHILLKYGAPHNPPIFRLLTIFYTEYHMTNYIYSIESNVIIASKC